jgi:hypothetical protein
MGSKKPFSRIGIFRATEVGCLSAHFLVALSTTNQYIEGRGDYYGKKTIDSSKFPELSAKVKQARSQKEVTQGQLSKKTGVDVQRLSK